MVVGGEVVVDFEVEVLVAVGAGLVADDLVAEEQAENGKKYK